MNRHALGLTYGLLGGLSLSLGGPIVRLLSDVPDVADQDIRSWQFLAWRRYAFTILMFSIALWRAGSLRGLGHETAKIGSMMNEMDGLKRFWVS